MAAIAGLDSLVNKMTGGDDGNPETMFYWKYVKTPTSAMSLSSITRLSLWRLPGIPGSGSAPGAVAAPTKATEGAIPFTNPGGGREKFIVSASQGYVSPGPNNIVIYDRLLHISGLDGTATAAQTVGGTITRNAGGVGNMIFFEIYSPVGASAVNITASYTNENGTAGRTTGEAVVGGAAGNSVNSVGAFTTLPLQHGDRGVQSVESVTLSASTGGVGDFGITVGRPLMVLSPTTGLPAGSSGLLWHGVAEIEADACITGFAELSSVFPNNGPAMMMLSTIEA